MLTSIRRAFAPKYESRWFWGLAFIALFVEFCFHALLPVSISNDSYGYLGLSKNLLNPAIAWERSVGYPLFLALLGTNLFDSLIPAILAQAAMAVAVPLLIFSALKRFGLEYAVLGGLIACLYFYNFVVSLSILTEPAYVFSIAVYAFVLVRYFSDMTTRNVLWVVAACWLIAMVRVSGTLHFVSFLAGIGLYVLIGLIRKRYDQVRLGVRHVLIACAVFFSLSLVQHATTNRISSVVWPHFVFNWVYKAPTSPLSYGIIKPENGPAAQKLFATIEKVVTDDPAAFNTLKAGGTKEVQALAPQKDGKYGPKDVALLMHDIIYNNVHDLRSWWIEGVLNNAYGIPATSKLMGDAIIEAFKTHPEVIVQRMDIIVKHRIWDEIAAGIDLNIVSFPTAYHHQIPKVMDQDPPEPLKPNMYKQWANDMFQHTGNADRDRDIYDPSRYPSTLAGAKENVKSDNLIGFGHYIGWAGTQILRLCWIFIGLGIAIFAFSTCPPLLLSLLCASILPPVASVFISETDPRHLLMSSPLQIVAAVLVLYSLIDIVKRRHA